MSTTTTPVRPTTPKPATRKVTTEEIREQLMRLRQQEQEQVNSLLAQETELENQLKEIRELLEELGHKKAVTPPHVDLPPSRGGRGGNAFTMTSGTEYLLKQYEQGLEPVEILEKLKNELNYNFSNSDEEKQLQSLTSGAIGPLQRIGNIVPIGVRGRRKYVHKDHMGSAVLEGATDE